MTPERKYMLVLKKVPGPVKMGVMSINTFQRGNIKENKERI